MATQKTLAILAEQTINPNGTITIRALELADGREVRTHDASKILGVCRDTIYLLCELGEDAGGLRAWKLPSARGNSPWRISLQSVLDYKVNRIKAVQDRRQG